MVENKGAPGADRLLSADLLRQAMLLNRQKVEELRAELSRAEQEGRLLEELVSLRHTSDPTTEGQDDGEVFTFSIAGGSNVSRSRHPVVDVVAGFLADEGHPLHINDIMKSLKEANVTLPGKGDQANVIAHMRRDPRFVRPSRGVYGLKEWGLKDLDGEAPVIKRTRVVGGPQGGSK